jgi:hypothetical protein
LPAGEAAKKRKAPLKELRAWLELYRGFCRATEVALLDLQENGTGGLESSRLKYLGGKKFLPALTGPALRPTVTVERSSFI